MSKFKVGDKVTVTRAITYKDKAYIGRISEVEREYRGGVRLNGYVFTDEQLELAEKPKATIINLPNAKIVINKPYVIYTDGKYTGKAKCNPEDVWSVEKGIEVAVERYKKDKSKKLFEGALLNGIHTGLFGYAFKPKTIEERFPIGSMVEMFKKSGEPITGFEVGTLARVTGYCKSSVNFNFKQLVQCNHLGLLQHINPDDLDLIVTRTVPNIKLTSKPL